jgi:Kef-type K+ transport system membrane component KefB
MVLIAAKIGAIIANKLKQPEVLGELIAGIVVGNLTLLNYQGLAFIGQDNVIAIFAELGVIILLFEIGLETNIKEMLAVGLKSFIVAVVGVITPFLIGYYISALILPDLENISRIFMGAILTATSVGITARVFKDLKYTKSAEAKIVLGAAVIDDILGLIILAIVSGMAQTGSIELSSVTTISVKAIGFVVLALLFGTIVARRSIKLLSGFNVPGLVLSIALVLCFISSYLAHQAGLATIVGAFCIGLVLDDVHFKSFKKEESVEHYIKPLSLFLVPIFFVVTGIHVDLTVFSNPDIIYGALAITAVAIVGKLICGWCFTSKTPINRMIIGVGMIPRGEVGLIFATVGKSIGVVNDEVFAITVIMVILTTLVAPPILGYLIKKAK